METEDVEDYNLQIETDKQTLGNDEKEQPKQNKEVEQADKKKKKQKMNNTEKIIIIIVQIFIIIINIIHLQIIKYFKI